jgi:hypothetical protein
MRKSFSLMAADSTPALVLSSLVPKLLLKWISFKPEHVLEFENFPLARAGLPQIP